MRKLWFILLIICLGGSALCPAQKSVQVRELENQRKVIEKEIATTSGLLEQAKASAQRSLARLNLLTKQIEQRKQMIALLSQEITATDKEIANTRNEIALLEKELVQKREKYTGSLRLIQKHRHSQDKLLFIFSASSFAQSVRRMRYLREYAAWQKQQGADIAGKQKVIQTKSDELEKSKAEKQNLLLARESEYGKIAEEEAVQKQDIAVLNRKQRELQDDLARKQRRAELLSEQIKQQIAGEVARAAAEAKASKELAERSGANAKPNENRREAESPGGYAMTRDERQLSEGFAAIQGNLPSPVNQPYTIVSDYGEQQHPNLKYVRIVNHGLDLQTSANADACAVFEGTVRAIFIVEPGYSIIVRHGNYLTVYSNLSEVYVKKDDVVKARQPLGRVYTDDSNGNATILHFELWKENNRQNPRSWLKM
ncbi:peptidase M23 [Bacteroidia bacterium]|nr:peptidase M23 [Bacteroidia bacterium]